MRRWIAGKLGVIDWDWRSSDPSRDFAGPVQWMAQRNRPSAFANRAE
jgi:hypothetical protein